MLPAYGRDGFLLQNVAVFDPRSTPACMFFVRLHGFSSGLGGGLPEPIKPLDPDDRRVPFQLRLGPQIQNDWILTRLQLLGQ